MSNWQLLLFACGIERRTPYSPRRQSGKRRWTSRKKEETLAIIEARKMRGHGTKSD